VKKVLVTGSAGLIGSEAVKFFAKKGFEVIGIDNNARKYFFGESASTDWNRKRLQTAYDNYTHINVDIRDEKEIEKIFKVNQFDLIIHTAAQPSHDWAACIVLMRFLFLPLRTKFMATTLIYYP
jgi:CDP-paratose 2-epimerase